MPGLLALAFPLAAQVVRGAVSEAGSGTPLAGAMVVLFDADGDRVDRVLTDASGGFSTEADRPGRYYVRVDRIGYASLTTDPFDVPVAGTFQRIAVPIRPIRLRGLDVAGTRRCEVRPEEGRVTARVWEEARKALQAAAWTQSTGVYRYTLLHFVRDLDRSGDEVLEERQSFKRGSSKAPFVSLPGSELVARGFVQEEPDSGTIYYAPDAEAFLSDAFLDTHCMGARRGDAGSIGLVFEPVEGRTLPDIEGVLWLDEETAQLDRLEFSYVNVSRSREIGEPGGQVTFTRLPDGTWIVREWWIRMPMMETVGRRRLRRRGYREQGGVAWRVANRAGEIVLESSTATITGSVQDSISTGPASSATVRVLGTGEEVGIGTDGSFLLPGLTSGLHRLVVRHELLDTLGLPAPVHQVASVLGEMVHVSLRVPTLEDALLEVCGGAPRPPRTAPLFGRVIDVSGRPQAGRVVRVAWLDTGAFEPQLLAIPPGPQGEPAGEWRVASEGDLATLKALTDQRGSFMLCDVPFGSRVRLDVAMADGVSVSRRPLVRPGIAVAVVVVTIAEGAPRRAPRLP